MADEVDKIILDMVQLGETGLEAMSKRTGLSVSQCSRRVQILRDTGFVTRTVCLLNPLRLNLAFSAFLLIALESHSPEHEQKFRRVVDAIPEIVSVDYTTGDADFILKIVTRDLQQFSDLLSDRLLPNSGIKSVKTCVILKGIKNTTRLPIQFA